MKNKLVSVESENKYQFDELIAKDPNIFAETLLLMGGKNPHRASLRLLCLGPSSAPEVLERMFEHAIKQDDLSHRETVIPNIIISFFNKRFDLLIRQNILRQISTEKLTYFCDILRWSDSKLSREALNLMEGVQRVEKFISQSTSDAGLFSESKVLLAEDIPLIATTLLTLEASSAALVLRRMSYKDAATVLETIFEQNKRSDDDLNRIQNMLLSLRIGYPVEIIKKTLDLVTIESLGNIFDQITADHYHQLRQLLGNVLDEKRRLQLQLPASNAEHMGVLAPENR